MLKMCTQLCSLALFLFTISYVGCQLHSPRHHHDQSAQLAISKVTIDIPGNIIERNTSTFLAIHELRKHIGFAGYEGECYDRSKCRMNRLLLCIQELRKYNENRCDDCNIADVLMKLRFLLQLHLRDSTQGDSECSEKECLIKEVFTLLRFLLAMDDENDNFGSDRIAIATLLRILNTFCRRLKETMENPPTDGPKCDENDWNCLLRKLKQHADMSSGGHGSCEACNLGYSCSQCRQDRDCNWCHIIHQCGTCTQPTQHCETCSPQFSCLKCLQDEDCKYCRDNFGCKCNSTDDCQQCLNDRVCDWCSNKFGCRCNSDHETPGMSCNQCLRERECSWCQKNYGCKCDPNEDCNYCLRNNICDYCQQNYGCKCNGCKQCLRNNNCIYCQQNLGCKCRDTQSKCNECLQDRECSWCRQKYGCQCEVSPTATTTATPGDDKDHHRHHHHHRHHRPRCGSDSDEYYDWYDWLG